MDDLTSALRTALSLIVEGDEAVVSALRVSLEVSIASTAIAACLGIPCGYRIGSRSFRGKQILVTALHTLMSLPTVVIGLLVYAALSRRGVFGGLGWLYTKKAIVCGQVLLAWPLMTALALSATESLDPRLRETAISLGARGFQVLRAALHEGRLAYVAAVVTAFGRVVSEVGIAMMAGGNIRGSTRTITTAIALESSKGEFASGVALGLILVTLAFFITAVLNTLQHRHA